MLNKTLMAAAILLVAGSPLAFAANSSKNLSTAELTTKHCSVVDQQLSQTKFKTETARQIAEEKVSTVCRQDRHKDGGAQADGGARGASSKG